MPTVDAALIPPGPWFRWHEDVFTVPPAARELVRVGDVPLAFAARRSVGLQFHPEVGAELVAEWIEGGRRQLAELAIDPDALGEQMARAARGARERAYDLFDRVAHHWSRATPDA
jgi:hypothetical protein